MRFRSSCKTNGTKRIEKCHKYPKKKGGSSRLRKRMTAGSLVILMTVMSIVGLPGAGDDLASGWLNLTGTQAVHAATISEDLLTNFVQQNLGSAARYSEITTEMIEEAVKSQHTDGTNWSTVILPNVLRWLGDSIADTYTETKTTTNEDGSTEETEVVTTVNPWLEESANSPDSPYAPGVNYQGTAMNTNYTLGQFIVDYIRETNAGAAYLTDNQIIEVYDSLAAGDDDGENPFVDEDQLLSAILGAVESAKNKPYSDQDVESAIDTSRYITYGDYVMSRGTPIPAGYLYIGTWLMDAQNITTTMYRMAVDSMANDSQQIMLYKSELSGSYWKDIYGATGLEYILPLAENVEEASMMNYYVSIVVGSDGIPRWAKTGEAADIFSIVDPYELEQLPELRSLHMLYNAGIVSSTDSGSKMYTYWRLNHFFNYDSPYTRNATMERDAKYVIEVSGRTGILFMATKPNSANWWGYDCYEHSGRGFLESIEQMAETYPNEYNEYRFGYNYDAYDRGRISRRAFYSDRLISGAVVWKNEVAWRNEVNAFGGEQALSDRITNYQYLWKHYSSVHNDVTDEMDRDLANMGNIYSQIRAGGTSEDLELANEVMEVEEMLDSTRRAEVYRNLVDNEEHNYVIGPVLNFLYQQVAYGETSIGLNYKILLNTTEDFVPESSIVNAVENAITDCTSSQYKYQAIALEEGSTISSQTKYALVMDVVNRSPEGPVAVRGSLRSLVDLDNINNSVVGHKSRELNFLNDTLLPTADSKYQEMLHSGVGETYRLAAADPLTGQQTLEEILKDQKADVSSVASELQGFIKARAMRLSTDDAIAYIHERIDWAEAQRRGIATDAFGTYAGEALDEHLLWLRELLKTIEEGGELDGNETNWKTIKESLELELLTALDENDLDKAAEVERQLEEAEQKLEEEEAAKRKIVNDPNASAAEKAEAIDVSTPSGMADQIVDNVLGQIGDGDYDILDALGALEALGTPRMPEIIAALSAHDAPSSIINQAKKVEENIGGSPFNDRLTNIDPNGGNGEGGLGNGDTGDGSGEGDTNPTEPSGVGPNGNGGDDDNGEGNPPEPGDDTGTGGNNNNNNGTGDDNNGGNGGDGTGGNGSSGTGPNGTGGSGDGNGDSDNNTGEADRIAGDPITGPGTGLTQRDFDNAIREAFNKDFDDLTPDEQAAVVLALTDFAKARDDKNAYNYMIELLNELIRMKSPFIYRQYLEDPSQEYVSLGAISRCRRYTRFRMVSQKDEMVTMSQIVGGSASYVFTVGGTEVVKNNGSKSNMEYPVVTQTDEYIYGSKTAKYPYITEGDSGRYLYNTCAYVPGTEWAVLITPQTDKKIAQLLDLIDIYADGEQ